MKKTIFLMAMLLTLSAAAPMASAAPQSHRNRPHTQKLDNAVTKITERPITKAVFMLEVTANEEQIPRTWIITGLLAMIGSRKVSFALGTFKASLI